MILLIFSILLWLFVIGLAVTLKYLGMAATVTQIYYMLLILFLIINIIIDLINKFVGYRVVDEDGDFYHYQGASCLVTIVIPFITLSIICFIICSIFKWNFFNVIIWSGLVRPILHYKDLKVKQNNMDIMDGAIIGEDVNMRVRIIKR